MPRVEARELNTSRFALHSRTFRIFMAGSLISRVGDWMDLVALNWAVLQFTNSPLYLGLINACRLFPAFLLSIPAGILADRYDRRKQLIWLQAGMMLLTFGLGYLVENRSSFWLFAAGVTARSILAAMDPPIRNALVPNLVPESSLVSAIALNTAVLNLSRIVGPAIAGMLLSITDIANLFYLNGCSTAGVLLSLFAIGSHSYPGKTAAKREKATLNEAVNFIRLHPSVQSLLVLAIVPMVFGFPYTTMLPFFARDQMQLGPEGFALLLSVSSVGAVAATVWLSFGRDVDGAGKWLIGSIVGFGLSLLLFVMAKQIWVASVAMFLVGLTSQFYRTMSRITLQQQVPDQLRGRILSIALMDRGFIPLGALLMGAIAGWAGAFWAGVVMGTGCIAVTLAVIWKRKQIWHL
jgi:MFS family permease